MNGFTTTTTNITPDDVWDYFFVSPDNHNHGFNFIQIPRVVSLRPVSDLSSAAPWPQPRSIGPAGPQTLPLPTENMIQNPWMRQPVLPSPSFPGGTQTLPRDDSKLTIDEQNKALKKLKKEIYNPVPKTKRLFRRVSMFYREREKNGFIGKNKLKHSDEDDDDDEDGKRCAICLEDFEPREEVMITPCNHMFHEGCIEPWVRSHGQCPVCRFALCEQMKKSRSVNNNNNVPNVSGNELLFLLGRLLQ